MRIVERASGLPGVSSIPVRARGSRRTSPIATELPGEPGERGKGSDRSGNSKGNPESGQAVETGSRPFREPRGTDRKTGQKREVHSRTPGSQAPLRSKLHGDSPMIGGHLAELGQDPGVDPSRSRSRSVKKTGRRSVERPVNRDANLSQITRMSTASFAVHRRTGPWANPRLTGVVRHSSRSGNPVESSRSDPETGCPTALPRHLGEVSESGGSGTPGLATGSSDGSERERAGSRIRSRPGRRQWIERPEVAAPPRPTQPLNFRDQQIESPVPEARMSPR